MMLLCYVSERFLPSSWTYKAVEKISMCHTGLITRTRLASWRLAQTAQRIDLSTPASIKPGKFINNMPFPSWRKRLNVVIVISDVNQMSNGIMTNRGFKSLRHYTTLRKFTARVAIPPALSTMEIMQSSLIGDEMAELRTKGTAEGDSEDSRYKEKLPSKGDIRSWSKT